MEKPKHYYTLYEASYGTVKAKLKNPMTFEEAIKLGTNYCEEYGYVYHGTFNEDEIEDAHDSLRHTLYNI